MTTKKTKTKKTCVLSWQAGVLVMAARRGSSSSGAGCWSLGEKKFKKRDKTWEFYITCVYVMCM